MSLERRLEKAVSKRDAEEIVSLFEQIYNKYGKLVSFIISKYVGSKEDVEELTNDVFIRFSEVIFTIEYTSIKGYLSIQAKNKAIDFLRKMRSSDIVDYVEEIAVGEREDDKLLYNELVDDMREKLSNDEVNIILLHAVYSYSFVEIAERLQKPVATVRSTYHRAIKKYKERG